MLIYSTSYSNFDETGLVITIMLNWTHFWIKPIQNRAPINDFCRLLNRDYKSCTWLIHQKMNSNDEIGYIRMHNSASYEYYGLKVFLKEIVQNSITPF